MLTLSVCPKDYGTDDDQIQEIVVHNIESDYISPQKVLEQLAEYEEERVENVVASARAYAQDVTDYLMEVEEETENEIIEIRRKHYNSVIERLNKYQEDYRSMMKEVMERLSIVPEESASTKLKEIEKKHKEQLLKKDEKHQEQLRSQILVSMKEVEAEIVRIQELFSSNMIESPSYYALVEETQQTLFSYRKGLESLLAQKLSEEMVDESKQISSNCKSFADEIPAKCGKVIAEYKSSQEAREAALKPVDMSIQAPSTALSEKKVSFLKDYLKQQTALREFEDCLKNFIEDPKIKTYRLNLQQFIRTNINAISTGSDDHLKQKYRNLCQLFDGRAISFQDKIIKSTEHPQALSFCMSFAAKTFIVSFRIFYQMYNFIFL